MKHIKPFFGWPLALAVLISGMIVCARANGDTTNTMVITNSVSYKASVVTQGRSNVLVPVTFPVVTYNNVVLTMFSTTKVITVSVPVIVPTNAPIASAAEEFCGPFSSWKNVKDYGAFGNGISNDTAAIQAALTAVGTGTNSPVLYFPAGAYKISSMLRLIARSGVTIVGAHPVTTSFVWAGLTGQSTKMLQIDGVDYSAVRRLTFDGMGIADTAIDYSRVTATGYFPTGCEFSDLVIKGVATGIVGGGHAIQGSAEVMLLRCTLIKCSYAGIFLADWNSCDWWWWSCTFIDCARGISSFQAQSGGSQGAYSCLFVRSTVADIVWVSGGNYESRWNTSVGSAAHFVLDSGGAHNSVVQGLLCIDPTGIPIRVKSLDTALIEDCTFVGGPAISAMVDADLISLGNKSTAAGPLIFSVTGKTFESGTITNVVRSSVDLSSTNSVPTPAKSSLGVIEPTGTKGSDIQTAMNTAALIGGVVHIPFGQYSVSSALVAPVALVATVGDGPMTSLNWISGANPTGRVIDASAGTFRDFRIWGDYFADGIRVNGSRSVLCSQTVVSLATNAAYQISSGSLEGRAFQHKQGTVNGLQGIGVRTLGGTTVINGGASSDQRRYYEYSGGTLLVRDTWSESHGAAPEYWMVSTVVGGKMSAVGNRISVPVTTRSISAASNSGAIAMNNVDGPIYTAFGTAVAGNNSTRGLGQNYIFASTAFNNRWNNSGDYPTALPDTNAVGSVIAINAFATERASRPSSAFDLTMFRLTIERPAIGISLGN